MFYFISKSVSSESSINDMKLADNTEKLISLMIQSPDLIQTVVYTIMTQPVKVSTVKSFSFSFEK